MERQQVRTNSAIILIFRLHEFLLDTIQYRFSNSQGVEMFKNFVKSFKSKLQKGELDSAKLDQAKSQRDSLVHGFGFSQIR